MGDLEARLGYAYGQTERKPEADRLAAIALNVQVKDDGIIRNSAGQEYYRPAQIGSFYLAWDATFGYHEEKSSVYQALDHVSDMPPEYRGIIISNTETTFDAYAFLKDYRCLRYGVGCSHGDDGG